MAVNETLMVLSNLTMQTAQNSGNVANQLGSLIYPASPIVGGFVVLLGALFLFKMKAHSILSFLIIALLIALLVGVIPLWT